MINPEDLMWSYSLCAMLGLATGFLGWLVSDMIRG